jgi:hypothetical protein
VYFRWTMRYVQRFQPMSQFLADLVYIPIPLRKVLLTITRVQLFPVEGTRLYERLEEGLNTIVYIPAPPFLLDDRRASAYGGTLLGLIYDIAPWFTSPLLSSFTSTVLRSAPCAVPTDLREQALKKEIEAGCQEYSHRYHLDFSSIFSSDPLDRTIPLAPNIPPNPDVANQCFKVFSEIRSSIADMILVPKLSTKTCGAITSQGCFETFPAFAINDCYGELINGNFSTASIERMYYLSGLRVLGPSEMRSSWTYGDLRPRVYYAQGATTFNVAKYIQPIFNFIVNFFDVVHRYNRFLEPEGILLEDFVVTIFDYASFTSKLEEIIPFLTDMSHFFVGVTVHVVDAREGLVPVDLGELLEHYNHICNSTSTFDVTKVLGLKFPLVLRHTCGQLGVPGNIQEDTLLNGIHIIFMVGWLYARCVGDDSKVYRLPSSWPDYLFEDAIRNNGEISLEKSEDFLYNPSDDYESEAWHFAKRPYNRSYNKIHSSIFFVWFRGKS